MHVLGPLQDRPRMLPGAGFVPVWELHKVFAEVGKEPGECAHAHRAQYPSAQHNPHIYARTCAPLMRKLWQARTCAHRCKPA